MQAGWVCLHRDDQSHTQGMGLCDSRRRIHPSPAAEGTHQWGKFVTPLEVETELANNGCFVIDKRGVGLTRSRDVSP